MRRKIRGTLQISEDVKRLFMLAKPLNVTSSDFLQGLVLLHAREVRQRSLDAAGSADAGGDNLAESKYDLGGLNCLGRPRGARDLRPRKRRTQAELARLPAVKA